MNDNICMHASDAAVYVKQICLVIDRTRAAANCCHGKRRKRRHFVSFVMNISGAEFAEHCFNISRDILYLVFYHFSCKTYDVITFLVDILLKRHFSPF